MKILALMMLMVVGCGKTEVKQQPTETEKLEEENKRLKTHLENNKLKAKLEADNKKLKEEILRLSVVGTYEVKNEYGHTFKFILLDNGIAEVYASDHRHPEDGTFVTESKWKIVKGQIHITMTQAFLNTIGRGLHMFTINKDGNITRIAHSNITRISKYKVDGKRTDYPKENQVTYIKIK